MIRTPALRSMRKLNTAFGDEKQLPVRTDNLMMMRLAFAEVAAGRFRSASHRERDRNVRAPPMISQ